MTSSELKWYERVFYDFGKFITMVLTTFVFPLKITGREHLPKNGPFIVIANHISMWEVFFIGRLIFPLRTVFMAKSELHDMNKLFNWVLKCVGSFPVKRGTADIGAIKRALSVLKDGDVFAIFPEGTRNMKLDGSLLKFNNGAGYIALMSGAPVIPVLFADTAGFKLFRKVNITVGPPVDLSGLIGKGRMSGETTEQATAKVLGALIALM